MSRQIIKTNYQCQDKNKVNYTLVKYIIPYICSVKVIMFIPTHNNTTNCNTQLQYQENSHLLRKYNSKILFTTKVVRYCFSLTVTALSISGQQNEILPLTQE